MAKENLAGSLNAAKRGNSTPRPRMLILAPTRELAMQSHQVVLEVGSAKGVCIYGGVPKPAQKAELRANGGVDVVVATPGRLEDLLEENALSLSGDFSRSLAIHSSVSQFLSQMFAILFLMKLIACWMMDLNQVTNLFIFIMLIEMYCSNSSDHREMPSLRPSR